jgi:peptidoglycan/LPS O-acetylase OafA/YrhL
MSDSLISKRDLTAAGRILYLDGLRAYSIVVVVMGHAASSIQGFETLFWLPVRVLLADGRLGVRIFFVLSGFLITILLLKESDSTGKISLSGFYQRRIARIFPAFYTYILAIVTLTLLHVLDLNWKILATAATFTWNYGFLWSPPNEVAGQVLGHLWTISLEEQFYIIWPACLILLGKRRAEKLAVIWIVIFPLIRITTYFVAPSLRGQLMMMFHTGSDQIMWGAVGAFACHRGALDRVAGLKYRAAIPWLAGLAIFVLCPLVDMTRSKLVGAIPTVECASVMILILWLLSGKGGALRYTLETWPMVKLGLLSYSLYIWQSLFVLWSGLHSVPTALRIVGAVAAAMVSYWLIEVPMRARIRRWFSQSPPAHS